MNVLVETVQPNPAEQPRACLGCPHFPLLSGNRAWTRSNHLLKQRQYDGCERGGTATTAGAPPSSVCTSSAAAPCRCSAARCVRCWSGECSCCCSQLLMEHVCAPVCFLYWLCDPGLDGGEACISVKVSAHSLPSLRSTSLRLHPLNCTAPPPPTTDGARCHHMDWHAPHDQQPGSDADGRTVESW